MKIEGPMDLSLTMFFCVRGGGTGGGFAELLPHVLQGYGLR
jgi:hypothetical protein